MEVELASERMICGVCRGRDFDQIEKHLREWASPIFADMWKFHNPIIFTDVYDIAALEIQNNQVIINFNFDYWRRCGYRERCFIIVHEFLHYIFGHAYIPSTMDKEWANIAQDIQVNEYIHAHYPALTFKMRGRTSHAWVDTVFKKYSDGISRDENYTYYYELMQRCLK